MSLLTGKDCGLVKSVNLCSLLEKLDAEVLHSTASIWKYSRTPKVKAVDGLMVEAGNSWCLNSWVAWSGACGQQHQLIISWWTPEVSMSTMVFFSLSSHPSGNAPSPLGSLSSLLPVALTPVAEEDTFAGQHDPPWPRCKINPSASKEVFLKNSPVHFSIEWKGREEWALRQQEWQRRLLPKQLRHRNLPSFSKHFLQDWSLGSFCWSR